MIMWVIYSMNWVYAGMLQQFSLPIVVASLSLAIVGMSAGRLWRWMPILAIVTMRLSDGRLHWADIRIGSEALVSVSDCYSLELPIITPTKMKGWQVGVSINVENIWNHSVDRENAFPTPFPVIFQAWFTMSNNPMIFWTVQLWFASL